MTHHLATKEDLQHLEERLSGQMRDQEVWLTLRFGAMLAAAVVIMAALVRLL